MLPIKFPEQNCTIAKDQKEYLPLPAFQDRQFTVSCWKLNWRERLRLIVSGKIWLMQMNFKDPLQPQLMRLDSPFVHEKPRSNRLVK